MKTTLASIAAALEISTATVSMALRNHPRISPATRDLVHRTAERLGYRPNPMVSALMTDLRRNRAQTHNTRICFLTCFPTADGWTRFPTFVQCFQGIRTRAEELGYGVEIHWHGDADGKRLTQILESRGIPGIILAPLPSRAFPLHLDWSRFATVAIGHTFCAFPAHRVSNHQFKTVTHALARAVALGYRRPGIAIARNDADKVENITLAGYYGFRATHPHTDFIPPLLLDGMSEPQTIDWIHREKPDVILTPNERIHRFLVENGFRIPDQIGFVHLDWAPEKGDFAGIDQLTGKIGMAAIDLLVEQIHHNTRGIPETPKTVLLDGKWRDGPTLRHQSPEREPAVAHAG